MKISVPIEIRFERSYIPEPNSGCWLWLAGADKKGYGRIWDNDQKRLILSHRFSWTMHRGEVPKGLMVCHRCDLPSCVNPEHLFLGTNQDNLADMVKKGRSSHRYGEASSSAVLTEKQVREIRAAPSFRGCIAELAKKYGVALSTVSHLRTNFTNPKYKKWPHLA